MTKAQIIALIQLITGTHVYGIVWFKMSFFSLCCLILINNNCIQWHLSWETTAMRPPVLKDHIFLAEGPAFECIYWKCHQRPPAKGWPSRQLLLYFDANLLVIFDWSITSVCCSFLFSHGLVHFFNSTTGSMRKIYEVRLFLFSPIFWWLPFVVPAKIYYFFYKKSHLYMLYHKSESTDIIYFFVWEIYLNTNKSN